MRIRFTVGFARILHKNALFAPIARKELLQHNDDVTVLPKRFESYRIPSLQGPDYEAVHQRALGLPMSHPGGVHPFKMNPNDLENDLFNQLHMGSIIGQYSGFKFIPSYFYPVPRRTNGDLGDIMTVKVQLAKNVGFQSKLRASTLLRICISMLDKHYGKFIVSMEKLSFEAYWSLVKNEKAWDGLEVKILRSLKGDVKVSGEMKAVDRLCKATVQKIYQYNTCPLKDLARSIYIYLLHYREAESAHNIKFIDDIRLYEDGGDMHSVYLMHIAAVEKLIHGSVRVVDVNVFERKSRDLSGYIQCLLNLLCYRVHTDRRMELVHLFAQVRESFLLDDSCAYYEKDFTVFLKKLVYKALPGFPEMDSAIGWGGSYGRSIKDFNQTFFYPAM